jgi:hypothetical protein
MPKALIAGVCLLGDVEASFTALLQLLRIELKPGFDSRNHLRQVAIVTLRLLDHRIDKKPFGRPLGANASLFSSMISLAMIIWDSAC